MCTGTAWDDILFIALDIVLFISQLAFGQKI